MPIDNITPYLDLLLLADPSEEMIRAYTKAGTVITAFMEEQPVGVYVLVDHGHGLLELKNIAVSESFQGRGIGKRILAHAVETATETGAKRLEVGTGNSSTGQLAFYENAGFRRVRVDEGFFLRNYDEPIYENGMQCTDMIFLSQDL